jgi:hypothetical protein
MTTKRTGKSATPPTDHLRDVPTPLHGGAFADYAPAEAIRRVADIAEGTPDTPEVASAIATSDANWNAYKYAIKAADVARFGDPALATPAQRKARTMAKAGVYNRARLGAWTATLGDEGRSMYALRIAEIRLAKRLAKATKGVVTIDLIPDLPRRCDLTDVAHEVVGDLEQGHEPWHRLASRLDDAADDVVREALDDMGFRRHRSR